MTQEDRPYKPLDGSARERPCCSDLRAICCYEIDLRVVLIEFFIWLAWLCLNMTDVILYLLWGISGLFKSCMGACTPEKKPKHVVIVGASFGGLAVQRELSGHRGVRVTLVDFKKYFEYTPGVLRCLVEPSWLHQLTCPLPSSSNELLTATMTSATGEAVVVRDEDGVDRQLSFDYLVLATGSTYAAPIKPIQTEPTLSWRLATLTAAAAKLESASRIIVIGAGAVGVELVGEILTVYPGKHVIVVDFAKTILPGFDEAASKYTLAWLERAGVELMLGEAIDKIEETYITLKSGPTITADVVYKCVGVMPNTGMLKGTPFEGKGFRGSVEVNDQLQVAGHPSVYCVGDMMSHASKELKLGHTAEVNAHLVAHNILADVHGEPLLTYPRGVTGADWSPKIYCLSLGKYDAVVAFNGLILHGWFVAVIKWLLEWTKVAAAAERPVGIFFWWFADTFSNWLSRTILPPPDKADPVKDKAASRLSCSNPVLDFLMLNWLDNPILIDLGMLVLRVVTASLMVHHGLQKTGDPNGFAENVIAAYFPFLPGDPLFWTYLAASFELAGSFCITVGVFVRPAAALLAGTMVNAIAFQLMKFGLQNYPFGQPPSGPAYTFEPSLAFLAVCAHLATAGPGRFGLQTCCRPVNLSCSNPVLDFLMLNWLDNPILIDLGMLVLRVVTASLMVHHGLQKTGDPNGFAENVIAAYFPFLPGDPLFWTYLAASFELAGSFCITVGVFVRPAAALLAGTMVNAIAFQLMKFGLQNYPFGQPPSGPAYTFEPSLAFLAVCAHLATAGPGRFGLQTCCLPVRPVRVHPDKSGDDI